MVNAGTYPLWQQLAVTEGLSDEALPTVIEALCTTSRAFYGLYVAHYGDMITRLLADHRDRAHCFYLDVPVEETLARHTTKPIADKVGKDELRSWYRPLDLLPRGVETVIPASSSLTATDRKSVV